MASSSLAHKKRLVNLEPKALEPKWGPSFPPQLGAEEALLFFPDMAWLAW